MSFKKHDLPQSVEDCKNRQAAMEQIDTNKGKTIDYGSEGRTLTAADFKNQITGYENKNTEYNKALKVADDISNELKEQENKLKSMYTEILLSAKGKFGLDASEVELLGGTRASERKKTASKANASVPSPK